MFFCNIIQNVNKKHTLDWTVTQFWSLFGFLPVENIYIDIYLYLSIFI
jgi:hypothetical protein